MTINTKFSTKEVVWLMLDNVACQATVKEIAIYVNKNHCLISYQFSDKTGLLSTHSVVKDKYPETVERCLYATKADLLASL